MNISDLLKKIQGVTNNDVEEAFDKAVEAARGEAKDFEAFILVTNKQTALCGNGAELLALICTVINDLKQHGLPKEEAIKAVDLAYMSEEEVSEKAAETLKKNKKELNKIKKVLDILKGDEDNE